MSAPAFKMSTATDDIQPYYFQPKPERNVVCKYFLNILKQEP